MKQKLINTWLDLGLHLPARTMEKAYPIYKLRERIEAILWGRYGYDIALKYSFSNSK